MNAATSTLWTCVRRLLGVGVLLGGLVPGVAQAFNLYANITGLDSSQNQTIELLANTSQSCSGPGMPAVSGNAFMLSLGCIFNPGETYAVTVTNTPPGTSCTLSNASGITPDDDVAVGVACSSSVPKKYSFGGSVSGLPQGESLGLYAANSPSLTIFSNGPFSFEKKLDDGSSYDVGIFSSPSDLICTVSNGSGIIDGADISDITIECEPISPQPSTYLIGGSVSGLPSGAKLTLSLGSEQLDVTSNGYFAFETMLDDGEGYQVAIATQPNGATCTLSNGSGMVDGADVSDLSVSCIASNNPPPLSGVAIGGSISGLPSGATLKLMLMASGFATLDLTSNGSFTFSRRLAEGENYTIITSPPLPDGVNCSLSNTQGTAGTSDITNVGVTCSSTNSNPNPQGYKVGGTISGLPAGTSLDLSLTSAGTLDFTFSGNGTFAFTTRLQAGANYSIGFTPPNGVSCTVTPRAGTIGTSDVTNTAITCTTASTTTQYSIGGTLKNLPESTRITISKTPGGDGLVLRRNGSFTFVDKVDAGAQYTVSVSEQPTGKTCVVKNATGTASANVTNIEVDCDPPPDNGCKKDLVLGNPSSSIKNESCPVREHDDTPAAVPDTDLDGITSSIEALVPGALGVTGDGNGDGVADQDQNNVSSFPNAFGTGYVTLVSASGRSLSTIQVNRLPDDFPRRAQGPGGSIAFVLNNVPVGGSETLKIYLPYDPAINFLYKKNRVTGRWDNVATSIGQVGTSKTVLSFRLVDGGPYDADGVANGVIVDPVIPAIVPTDRVQTQSGGGAFGGGLAALFAGLAALRRRRIAGAVLLLCVGAASAQAATPVTRINVRAEADLSSRIVAVVDARDQVEVIEQSGEFAKVRTPSGKLGYLKLKYLRGVEAPMATATQAPSHAAPIAAVPAAREPIAAMPAAPRATPAAVAPRVSMATVTATDALSPWYVYALAGLSQSQQTAAQLQQSLDAAGQVVVQSLDRRGAAFALMAGYSFTPHWALEAGVLDLGEFGAQIDATGADADTLQQVLRDQHPVGGYGLAAALAGRYGFGDWALTGRAGMYRAIDRDIELRVDGQTQTLKGSASSALFGAGLSYALTPRWETGVAVNALHLNDSVYTYGLMLGYRL